MSSDKKLKISLYLSYRDLKRFVFAASTDEERITNDLNYSIFCIIDILNFNRVTYWPAKLQAYLERPDLSK